MLYEAGMLYEGPYHLDHSGHVVEPEGALVVPAHHQANTLERINQSFPEFLTNLVQLFHCNRNNTPPNELKILLKKEPRH